MERNQAFHAPSPKEHSLYINPAGSVNIRRIATFSDEAFLVNALPSEQM
jgi:hypothetical protein